MLPARAVCFTACSPGYYARPDSLTTCEGCGRDHWCPGGVGAAAQQNACGSCLMTVTTLAQDSAACVTQAGCGYQTDGSGSVCRIGTYSAGSSQQPCTPCPSGLTTVAARSESVAACMAPPGYIFQVRTWLHFLHSQESYCFLRAVCCLCWPVLHHVEWGPATAKQPPGWL